MKIKKVAALFCDYPIKALGLCYTVISAIALSVIFLLGAGISFAHLGGYFENKQLNLNDFQHIGVEQTNDMEMVNVTDDTQLIYTGNAHNLYVKCSFSYDPGEFVLFYSHNKDGGFGTSKMLYAKKLGDYYVFEMPINTQSFRLDTGIYPSIAIEFEEISLNKNGFFDILKLSTGSFFWLFVLPPIVFGMISFFIDIWLKIRKKKDCVSL